jgi:hypothetical protein
VDREYLVERFWNKVDKTDYCWNWTASLNENGYGLFRFNGKTSKAHRVSYIITFGEIADGLVIDHLCKNKKCVNPEHLDPVSQGENVVRGLAGKVNNFQSTKTHCKSGHQYSRITKDGYRLCGQCRSEQTMKSRKRKSLQ